MDQRNAAQPQTYLDHVAMTLANIAVNVSNIRPEKALEYVMAAFPGPITLAFSIAGEELNLPHSIPARAIVDLRFRGLDQKGVLWKISNAKNFDWVSIQKMQAHIQSLRLEVERSRYEEFLQRGYAEFDDLSKRGLV